MSNSDNVDNTRIEEYKTLREEILELDKRKNNLIVYTVIATATIFGFAIESPSPFIFLLPLVVIIPLGYQVLDLQRSILLNATYISIVIESEIKGLKWETFMKDYRKEFGKKKRLLRQLSNYMLFDLLGILCVVSSVTYALTIDENISSFIYSLLSESGQLLLTLIVLVVLWIVTTYILVKWTLQMKDCYGPKSQNDNEKDIRKVLNIKDEEVAN